MTNQTILVGIDASRAARVAVRWAADHAQREQASLVVIHAYPLEAGRQGDPIDQLREAHARARATKWVNDALSDVPQRPPVRVEVVAGQPGRVLAFRSQAARMLVLGSPTGGVLHRLAPTSASRYSLSHAACPVVFVPLTPAIDDAIFGASCDQRPER